MTLVCLDADTSANVFCKQRDLASLTHLLRRRSPSREKAKKPWIAMREFLITYLAITLWIALLLTGPDEDDFPIKHVLAAVFGWPLVVLVLASLAWPALWRQAKR